jgi:hypothetical protein
VRLARAHCELGDFDAAAAKLACACSLQPEDAELQREYQVRASFYVAGVMTTSAGGGGDEPDNGCSCCELHSWCSD